eukprot:1123880-Pyramimonas_sp.AAC.1
MREGVEVKSGKRAKVDDGGSPPSSSSSSNRQGGQVLQGEERQEGGEGVVAGEIPESSGCQGQEEEGGLREGRRSHGG